MTRKLCRRCGKPFTPESPRQLDCKCAKCREISRQIRQNRYYEKKAKALQNFWDIQRDKIRTKGEKRC